MNTETLVGSVNKGNEAFYLIDYLLKNKKHSILYIARNDKEIFDILDWCKKNHFDISLIEIMPIGDIGEKRFNQYLSMKKFEEGLVKRIFLTKDGDVNLITNSTLTKSFLISTKKIAL